MLVGYNLFFSCHYVPDSTRRVYQRKLMKVLSGQVHAEPLSYDYDEVADDTDEEGIVLYCLGMSLLLLKISLNCTQYISVTFLILDCLPHSVHCLIKHLTY